MRNVIVRWRVLVNPAGATASILAWLGLWVAVKGGVQGATFSEDVQFLKSHAEVIVLSDRAGEAKVALVPAMQGRVLTSTAQGDAGPSYGWINRELIASRKTLPHINVFGGEDRFWMGPEGGQFSIFFAQGAPFDLEHWFTPPPLDTEAFETVAHNPEEARFRHAFHLTNYSGTRFEVAVNRTVRLLDREEAWKRMGAPATDSVRLVAFESINQIQNTGPRPWIPETGLLSIWILGMFNPSDATTVVIPINPGPEDQLGKPVTSDYFGPVPPERLLVRESAVFFKADGKYRSKIGINPQRCKPVLGSYDAAQRVLTLVQFTFQEGQTNYVNSLWQIQSHPYAGDAANSYNDGPPAPGAKPLGPFYELESSSPAAALAPGQSLEHVHRTIHLTGPDIDLDRIARRVLGVGIQEIAGALPRPK